MPREFWDSVTKARDSKINSSPQEHDWDKWRKRYIYPMITIQEDEYRYSFYCSNPDVEIRDNIFLRKASFINNEWIYGEEKLVLPHGAEEKSGGVIWDKKHVCDPAVVAGEFNLNGEKYRYAMFHTGTRDDDNKGDNNSLGVAFAKKLEGPWFKRNGPLLIPEEQHTWGVGQPSATSIDGKGKVILFYTRGSGIKTRMFRHPIDLSDIKNPIIKNSDAMELALHGLKQLDGSPEFCLNNGFFMYDHHKDCFWLVRDGHPYPKDDYISEFVQVSSAPGSLIWGGEGEWRVLGNIKTSGDRSHNARFITNIYGGVLNSDLLEINVTKAVEPRELISVDSNARLWSYRPITFTVLPDSFCDEQNFLRFKI